MVTRNNILFALFAMALLSNSCATILYTPRQKIAVTGAVEGPVQLLVDGRTYADVRLPTTIKVWRKAEPSTITAMASGYQLSRYEIGKTINPIVAADILFPPFAVMDWASGAYKQCSETSIALDFVPADDSAAQENYYGLECLNADELEDAERIFQNVKARYPDNEDADINLMAVSNRRAQLELERANRKENRRERWEMVGTIFLGVATVAGATADVVAATQGRPQPAAAASTRSSTGSSSGSTAQAQSSSKASPASHSSCKNADRAYGNYETMLINMHVYCKEKGFNDADRRNYQSKMRSIRQQWTSRDCIITQSSWETWNGSCD
jgi:hypothetical protein